MKTKLRIAAHYSQVLYEYRIIKAFSQMSEAHQLMYLKFGEGVAARDRQDVEALKAKAKPILKLVVYPKRFKPIN